MDEYAVLVDGVVRDALGLDGARGAGDLPAREMTAPCEDAFTITEEQFERGMQREADALGPVGSWANREAGPSPAGE